MGLDGPSAIPADDALSPSAEPAPSTPSATPATPATPAHLRHLDGLGFLLCDLWDGDTHAISRWWLFTFLGIRILQRRCLQV